MMVSSIFSLNGTVILKLNLNVFNTYSSARARKNVSVNNLYSDFQSGQLKRAIELCDFDIKDRMARFRGRQGIKSREFFYKRATAKLLDDRLDNNQR